MRAALIGYGTMGRLVYEELGSECAVVIAPNGPDCMNNLFEYEKPIDIIIDFLRIGLYFENFRDCFCVFNI